MNATISRRSLIAGVAAATTAALPGSTVLAALSCSPFNAVGVQECTAGLQIGDIRTAQQRCQNWCWAACIEAIFALHGYSVHQERIVSKVFGTTVCQPAVGPQIVGAINGAWRDDQGRSFNAMGVPLLDIQFGVWNMNAAVAVATELANNNPLINGAVGHATVLTAMTYLRDMASRGMPTQIIVRDPWPGNPNRRVLNAQEVAGTNFLAMIRVS